MRRTAQTRVVGADPDFNGVHHGFGDLAATLQVVLGYRAHRAIDDLIVVCGGHNQIGEGDVAPGTGTIVMEQRAARGFDDTDALTDPCVCVGSGSHDQVLVL